MDFITNIIGGEMYTFLILPFLIFLARVTDVSIGTIRVIFISRGLKFLAPVLGFFEVLIWLAAIQQVMANLNNIYCYIAYAGGFATGTFVGIVLEEKISVGKVMVRIVTGKDSTKLMKSLKEAEHTFTTMGAKGPDGKVKLIFSVIDRHDINKVIKAIKQYNPKAFYSVEDVRITTDKIKHKHSSFTISIKNIFGFYRKGK